MNNDYLIINYVKDKSQSVWLKTDSYKFKKIAWIKKILLKLNIIEEYEESKPVEVAKKIIYKSDIAKMISEFMNFNNIHPSEIEHFEIGRKQIDMQQDEFFRTSYVDNFRNIRTIYGIEIRINPFIDGIVPVFRK